MTIHDLGLTQWLCQQRLVPPWEIWFLRLRLEAIPWTPQEGFELWELPHLMGTFEELLVARHEVVVLARNAHIAVAYGLKAPN